MSENQIIESERSVRVNQTSGVRGFARALLRPRVVATVLQPRECVPGDQGVCWTQSQIRAGSSAESLPLRTPNTEASPEPALQTRDIDHRPVSRPVLRPASEIKFKRD